MKKISIIVASLLLVSGVIFYSCTKDKNIKESKKDIVNEFVETLNSSKASFQSKSLEIGYPENPYDSMGIIHNNILEKVNNHNSLNTNIYEAISFLEHIFNKQLDDNFYINEFKKFKLQIIINDTAYNTEFINSLTNISNEEKGLVNNYFLILLHSKDINEVIYLSKVAELYIINNTNLSSKEKERILSTFAIFRNSSSFWVKINPQKLSSWYNNLMFAVADGVARYCIANCIHVNCDDFQDGKDVNMYTSTMSIMAYYGGGPWSK